MLIHRIDLATGGGRRVGEGVPGRGVAVLMLMLTSKGMAGIPGSAFLALSATAAAVNAFPPGAVALLLAADRLMDTMRVVTNLLGDCVATFVVARWEGMLDIGRAKAVLAGEPLPDPTAHGARDAAIDHLEQSVPAPVAAVD